MVALAVAMALLGLFLLSPGSTPQKKLTDIHPSNISGVYTPKIFDGCMSVNHLTHAHVSVMWGVYNAKYLTPACPSNIWGVYTPQIFDGHTSVKCLRVLHPQNI